MIHFLGCAAKDGQVRTYISARTHHLSRLCTRLTTPHTAHTLLKCTVCTVQHEPRSLLGCMHTNEHISSAFGTQTCTQHTDLQQSAEQKQVLVVPVSLVQFLCGMWGERGETRLTAELVGHHHVCGPLTVNTAKVHPIFSRSTGKPLSVRVS